MSSLFLVKDNDHHHGEHAIAEQSSVDEARDPEGKEKALEHRLHHKEGQDITRVKLPRLSDMFSKVNTGFDT